MSFSLEVAKPVAHLESCTGKEPVCCYKEQTGMLDLRDSIYQPASEAWVRLQGLNQQLQALLAGGAAGVSAGGAAGVSACPGKAERAPPTSTLLTPPCPGEGREEDMNRSIIGTVGDFNKS